MSKRIYYIIAIIGVIIISMLAFIIPSNPNEIIPALTPITIDKPLWLCIIIGGNSLYIYLLFSFYEYTKIQLRNK